MRAESYNLLLHFTGKGEMDLFAENSLEAQKIIIDKLFSENCLPP
jgi:hypothetical protein